MEQLTSWEEMTTVEQYACIHWDMYKDAFGIRPRGVDTSSWTEADYLAEFKQLEEIIEREDIARKAAEVEAVTKFENRVATLVHAGTDRERVIAWLMDAEGANGDFEYFCFTQGLPYRYFAQKEIA